MGHHPAPTTALDAMQDFLRLAHMYRDDETGESTHEYDDSGDDIIKVSSDAGYVSFRFAPNGSLRCEDGTPAISLDIDDEHVAAERDALAAFKHYVHKRLDDAGIPANPGGPHSAEGCRVGDRLDELIGQRDALLVACNAFVQAARDAHGHWDADRDSKVGKLLAAMGGGLAEYRADLTAAHAAIAKAATK